MLLVPTAMAAVTAVAMAVTMPVVGPVVRAVAVVMSIMTVMAMVRKGTEGDKRRQRRDIGMIVMGAGRHAGEPQSQQPGERHHANPVYMRLDHLSLHQTLIVAPI